MLRCRFVDSEDQAWITTFHKPAQYIPGMTGDEVRALELQAEEGGREQLETAIRNRYFEQPFQATVRAKLESYKGQLRTNITCSEAHPVQRRAHGRMMLKDIYESLAE